MVCADACPCITASNWLKIKSQSTSKTDIETFIESLLPVPSIIQTKVSKFQSQMLSDLIYSMLSHSREMLIFLRNTNIFGHGDMFFLCFCFLT